jgi:ABC-type transport system substrate-binding protein
VVDQTNYWRRTLSTRTTRRRVIQSAGALGTGVAALSLIGCGGDSDSDTDDASGKLYTPVDTSEKATRGGLLPRVGSNRGFDVTRSAAENGNASPSYSRLVKYQTFKHPERTVPSVVPDAATDWEISPDGLTATYKLRPNMKFDSVAPTHGKVMTAADVKFSWDFYERLSVGRDALSNSVNPDAAIVNASTPDANTIVFKLAFRYAPLNTMLAFNRYLYILPTEADGGYNYKVDMRGTGAWRLKEFSPDSRAVFQKNPDWYDAGKVYLDELVYHVVPEYATQLAQFRSGNLATIDFTRTQEDIMAANDEFDRTPFWLRFGYVPGSPFRDERVRRAASMVIDRDLYVETFGNVDQFRLAGLEAPTAWHTCFGAGEVTWLDPKDEKAFGESAKWFKHDPAESKKLLTAAGITTPLATQMTLSGSPAENTLARPAEVLVGMWNDSGLFNFKFNYVDLNSVFRPQFHWNYGQHEGISIGGGGADYPDPDGNLQANFKSGVPRSGFLAADGKTDSYLDDLIEKQRVETDWNKRLTLFHDYQRHFASKMYFLHQPGDALGFLLAHPWFGNWRVYRGQSDAGGGSEMQEGGIHYWIDSSKRA